MSKKNRGSGSKGEGDENANKSASKGSSEETPRRVFLKTTVAAGVALCAAGPAMCAGARAVLAPTFQETGAGKFHPLVTVDSLTSTPQQLSIIDDRQDAWMKLTEQKIGAVFLRKAGDRILAFQSLCPHAGCKLQVGVRNNPKTGEDEELFLCPCHGARFDLDGARLDTVAPRDLDTLETKVENGVVFVKYEHFIFGIAEKRS